MAQVIARVLVLAVSTATVLGAQLDSARTTAARALVPGLPAEIRSHAESYLVARDTAARHLEAGRLACSADAVEFVLAVLPAEPEPSIRKDFFICMLLPWWQGSAHADQVLLELLGTDPDTGVIARAAGTLRSHMATRVRRTIEQRRDATPGAPDPALARVLGNLEEEWTLLESALLFPKFLREPPPVFAVPETKGMRQVRVVAFGDFGFDEVTEDSALQQGWGKGLEPWESKVAATLQRYQARRPFHFGITLGDNFYPEGIAGPVDARWKRLWDDKYGALGIPLYPSFGNHDWYDGSSPAAEVLHTQHSRTWRFPAEFYTFTAGPVQFFAIDGNNLSVRQLAWLQAALEQSHAQWKVVYGHFPPYFTAGKPSDFGGLQPPTEDTTIVRKLVPVLKGRADVYIAGHSHTFQFFKPIDGVCYIIAGTGGAPLYKVDPDDPRLLYATASAGFTSLDVTDSTFTVQFIGLDGKAHFEHALRKGT